MRRASTLASPVLSRTLGTAHGGAGGFAPSFSVQNRIVQAALYGSRAGNANNHRRWFSPFLAPFSGSSAQGATLGVAGGLITVVATTSFYQEVYAKEPPPAEVVPKEVVLYQYEACPFCNKVKGNCLLSWKVFVLNGWKCWFMICSKLQLWFGRYWNWIRFSKII